MILEDIIGGKSIQLGQLIELQSSDVNPVLNGMEFLASGNVREDEENYPDMDYDVILTGKELIASIASTSYYDMYTYFRDDGLMYYVSNRSTRDMRQYSLTVPYDLSTQTLVYEYIDIITVAPPVGFTFKPDGTKLYIGTSATGYYLHQFTLSTAWDLSTATDDSLGAFSTNHYAGGLSFNSDGTELLIAYTDRIRKFTLSSAWDLSTISTEHTEHLTTINSAYGGNMTSDGRFILTFSGGTHYLYKLYSPFDLASGYILKDTWVTGITTDGGCISQDGSHVIITDRAITTRYSFKIPKGIGLTTKVINSESNLPLYMRIK